MWLYTSYARQPHRSVASKNGDFRYHGPKYKVLEVTSGIALAPSLTAPPSFHRGAWPARPANPGTAFVPPLRLNRCSIRSAAQGGTRVRGFLTLPQHARRLTRICHNDKLLS